MDTISEHNQHARSIVFKLLIEPSIFILNRIIIIIGSFIMITALLFIIISDLLITLSDYIKLIRIEFVYNTKPMGIRNYIEDMAEHCKHKMRLYIEK